MVKFSLKKMLAVGLLSTTAVFAGITAVHWNPVAVAYADTVPGVTPTGSDCYQLVVNTTNLKGNYIYVAYYTDEACTKLKSTTVYTKTELEITEGDAKKVIVPLGSINLKKGGFIKVYDEITGAKDVKAVEIAAQVPKVKVKVAHADKDTFSEALDVTVGGAKLDFSKYAISLEGEGFEKRDITSDTEANTAWVAMKLAARMNGLTVNITVKEKTPEDGKLQGMPSTGKFKVAAAAKAPKVTIDYVNGKYVLPKDANYIVTSISSDNATKGQITVPTTLTGAVSVAAKTSLGSDEIVGKLNDDDATQAAIIVWGVKKDKMNSVQAVYVVDKLKEITTDDTITKDTTRATYKVGDKEVAKITFSETGISIEAKADLEYVYMGKPVKLKAGKSTKGELLIAPNSSIDITVLGTKATKTEDGTFGSKKTPITNKFGVEASNS